MIQLVLIVELLNFGDQKTPDVMVGIAAGAGRVEQLDQLGEELDDVAATVVDLLAFHFLLFRLGHLLADFVAVAFACLRFSFSNSHAIECKYIYSFCLSVNFCLFVFVLERSNKLSLLLDNV